MRTAYVVYCSSCLWRGPGRKDSEEIAFLAIVGCGEQVRWIFCRIILLFELKVAI